MATHNPRPDLFSRQLQSLRVQTVTDWQCLIFDDASADRTAVRDLLGNDSRFTVLPALPHLGAYRAFEHLLSVAEPGVPVFLCDQDDVWRPDKMDVLLRHDHTCFSAMRAVDETGRVIRERFIAAHLHALSPAQILLMNSVSGAALMVSPSVRRVALPFPAPELRGWHDQWLAAVAARVDGLDYIDEPLVDYTQHREQVAGEGLRRLTPQRVAAYGRRVRSQGPVRELRSRSGWLRAAAARLLDLPGGDDPDLRALAHGTFTRQLLAGVRSGQVPWSRAALLTAGNWLV